MLGSKEQHEICCKTVIAHHEGLPHVIRPNENEDCQRAEYLGPQRTLNCCSLQLYGSDFYNIEFNGSRRNKSKNVSPDQKSVFLQAVNSDFLQIIEANFASVSNSGDQSSHGFKEKASYHNSLKDCNNSFQLAEKNSEQNNYDETSRSQASFTVMINEKCKDSSLYNVINNKDNNIINNYKNDNNKNIYNYTNDNNNTIKLLRMMITIIMIIMIILLIIIVIILLLINKIFIYVLVKQQRCYLV